ncbi:MAG TPA: hypothetical protein VGK19_18315 [Capsulimonadaceae bacterium]|jgi:hypothetical protein
MTQNNWENYAGYSHEIYNLFERGYVVVADGSAKDIRAAENTINDHSLGGIRLRCAELMSVDTDDPCGTASYYPITLMMTGSNAIRFERLISENKSHAAGSSS